MTCFRNCEKYADHVSTLLAEHPSQDITDFCKTLREPLPSLNALIQEKPTVDQKITAEEPLSVETSSIQEEVLDLKDTVGDSLPLNSLSSKESAADEKLVIEEPLPVLAKSVVLEPEITIIPNQAECPTPEDLLDELEKDEVENGA